MKKITNYYRNLISNHNRSLLLLYITFLAFFVVFILPTANLFLKLTIKFWGKSYITSENVLSYLAYPPTILLLLLMVIVLSIFLLYLMLSMVCYSFFSIGDNKPKLLKVFSISFIELKNCIRYYRFSYPLFYLILFVFMNLPVLVVLTVKANTNFSGSSDLIFIKVLFLVLYTFLSFIALKGMFVIHFSVQEQTGFLNALELSKKLIKGRTFIIFRTVLLYNLLLTFIYFLLYYLSLSIVAVFIYLTVRKTMVLPVFLSVYPRINLVLYILFQMTAYLMNAKLISAFYFKFNEGASASLLSGTHNSNKVIASPIKRRHPVNPLIILILAAALANAYLTVQNNSFYLQEALTGFQVSSHRGNSHVAPENTLPALENAIIAGSDYAEIDVRQTRDGAFILLHDESLKRTAGIAKNIETLDLNDLINLDVGSWFSKDFMNTRIPTLDEAMQFCKGKIKLNIELKTTKRNKDFEEGFVSLIEQNDYEYSCVVSSTDLFALRRIKQLNENIRTGLILKYAYGNFYMVEGVDFFSIRSRYITRQMVESAHRAGKEIHAWTVNNVKEIERMKSIGVDCIVTDNPTLVKRVLFKDDSGITLIHLLIKILNR